MSLAIFDLDNTLIAGDSDHLWGEFIIEQGLVDADAYRRQNDRFFADYQKGQLDIVAYLNFALAPLAAIDAPRLALLHAQFVQSKIQPILLPKAQALVARHRANGDTLLVITATNRFITEPIVRLYGIELLLASEPEVVNGCYSGRATGVPCYQEGKVTRLWSWLRETGHSLDGSYFYSDSFNDIPLLKQVDQPVAVDPDARLAEFAREHQIPIISLR